MKKMHRDRAETRCARFLSFTGCSFPPPSSMKSTLTTSRLVRTGKLESRFAFHLPLFLPSLSLHLPSASRTDSSSPTYFPSPYSPLLLLSYQEYSRRYALTRPQTLVGNLSQSIAALTHHVSPARLQLIDDNVPKITILTGDDDNLVSPANSLFLAESMRGAESEFEGRRRVQGGEERKERDERRGRDRTDANDFFLFVSEDILWDRTGHASKPSFLHFHRFFP